MADNKNHTALESARTRLESALSRLAQGVASTRETISAAQEIAEEKIALSARVTALEKENLKLHEQIAAHALTPEQDSGSTHELEALQAEKAALEQNYQLLKRQYAALQDEMEAIENTKGEATPPDAALAAENADLKAKIRQLEDERGSVRNDLDDAIGRLETMVGSA